MTRKFTVIVQYEDDLFVARCVENDVASHGKSINEAVENLKEALELYLEDPPYDLPIPTSTFITSLEIAT
jgi:predicted RNase H-like HicB family nuclease